MPRCNNRKRLVVAASARPPAYAVVYLSSRSVVGLASISSTSEHATARSSRVKNASAFLHDGSIFTMFSLVQRNSSTLALQAKQYIEN
jgi:hypothetical protein